MGRLAALLLLGLLVSCKNTPAVSRPPAGEGGGGSGGSGPSACEPVEETCNGKDDDCDGAIDDEAWDRVVTCGKGICERSVTHCEPCFRGPADPIEDCGNGLDDTCDGLLDCHDSTCAGRRVLLRDVGSGATLAARADGSFIVGYNAPSAGGGEARVALFTPELELVADVALAQTPTALILPSIHPAGDGWVAGISVNQPGEPLQVHRISASGAVEPVRLIDPPDPGAMFSIRVTTDGEDWILVTRESSQRGYVWAARATTLDEPAVVWKRIGGDAKVWALDGRARGAFAQLTVGGMYQLAWLPLTRDLAPAREPTPLGEPRARYFADLATTGEGDPVILVSPDFLDLELYRIAADGTLAATARPPGPAMILETLADGGFALSTGPTARLVRTGLDVPAESVVLEESRRSETIVGMVPNAAARERPHVITHDHATTDVMASNAACP